MTFSQSLGRLAGLFATPRLERSLRDERSRFRRDLERRLAEPHLLRDMGFSPEAVAEEIRRRPDEPIRLRRGA